MLQDTRHPKISIQCVIDNTLILSLLIRVWTHSLKFKNLHTSISTCIIQSFHTFKRCILILEVDYPWIILRTTENLQRGLYGNFRSIILSSQEKKIKLWTLTELSSVTNNKGEKKSNWHLVVKLTNFHPFIGIITLAECILFYAYQ